jgi:tetratricopeptide (TPR) repeat protein
MSKKDELKELEKNCVEVKDYIELVRKALEEPSDREYANELLLTAEEECKFPSDYVLVAEGYSLLENKEKAYELFEQAEENAFEPLEFAQIGKSIFTCLSDLEKAKELFRRATKDVKKLSDAVAILCMIQANINDREIINELFGKIQSQCKSIEDYKNAINLIIEETGDIQLAKAFVQSVEGKLDGINLIIDFASLIFEVFNDKEWSIKLLDEITDDAQFTREFIKLANCYRRFGETDKATQMMGNAKDYAISGEEFLELAFAYWDFEQNKTLCESLIEKSLKDIKEQKQLIELAKFCSEKLNAPDLTKKILLQIESKAATANDYIALLQLAFALTDDIEFGLMLYDKLLEKVDSPTDLLSIAEDITQRTKDIERSKKFFGKAIQNCSSFKQMLEIAEKANALFGDKNFTFDILTQASRLAKGTTDYVLLAEKSFSLIDDKDFGIKNLEIAEELVTNLSEMRGVCEAFKNLLPDSPEYIQRVSEKLAKRETFQAKYDEFQKIENEAKYLQDYLKLAQMVMKEIDDIYYCRKLLSKAEKLLNSQFLNVDNYSKLAKAIIELTADIGWAILLFDNLYSNRIVFLNDLLQLCRAVGQVFEDKEIANGLQEKYINNSRNKISNSSDALKLAKIMVEFNSDDEDIVALLDKFIDDVPFLPIAIEFLKFAIKQNYDGISGKIKEKVWSLVHSPNDLVMLSKTMLEVGEPTDKAVEDYIKFVERIDSKEMLLTLVADFMNFLAITRCLINFYKYSRLNWIIYKKSKSRNSVLFL